MTFKSVIRKPVFGVWLLFVVLFLVLEASFLFAQTPAAPGAVEYRDPSWISSRNFIWILSQVHLLFGGFVLGFRSLHGCARSSEWSRKTADTITSPKSSPS